MNLQNLMCIPVPVIRQSTEKNCHCIYKEGQGNMS